MFRKISLSLLFIVFPFTGFCQSEPEVLVFEQLPAKEIPGIASSVYSGRLPGNSSKVKRQQLYDDASVTLTKKRYFYPTKLVIFAELAANSTIDVKTLQICQNYMNFNCSLAKSVTLDRISMPNKIILELHENWGFGTNLETDERIFYFGANDITIPYSSWRWLIAENKFGSETYISQFLENDRREWPCGYMGQLRQCDTLPLNGNGLAFQLWGRYKPRTSVESTKDGF